jgi:hypothetical protein
MNAFRTMIWLEWKKSGWLLIGTILLLFLIAPLISKIPEPAAPEIQTGTAGSSAGQTMSSTATTGTRMDSGTAIEIHGRQLAVVVVCQGLGIILLLGFMVIHYRESESGEIAMLYQSPIPGDLQLWTRFGYMVCAIGAVFDVVLLFYWALQRSQGRDFFGPIVGALGYQYQLDWINVFLIGMVLFVLPISAFILLFCQVQNAYALLNHRRISGVVLVIASIQAVVLSMGWVIERWNDSPIWIRIVHVPSLGGMEAALNPADPETFFFRAPVEVLAVSLFMTGLMMALAGRIWKEVEWS